MPAEPERDSVVPAGARFRGLVVLHGTARIDGDVAGELFGADELRIGEHAEIEADLAAREIWIAGRVRGEVRAGERVRLAPTARVSGRVVTPRLEASEGAELDGECVVGGG